MTTPKFRVGENVSVMADHTNGNVRPGTYTIVRVMPVSGSSCQYRAKNSLDAHERVLEEVQLQALGSGTSGRR